MKHLQSLTDPTVRDLAWAVFAPSLISDFSFHPQGAGVEDFAAELSAARWRWLQSLDRDPTPLAAYLQTLRSTRLGVYFEALWRFFVHHDPQFELVAANLPVADHGKTVGEFDILLFDHERGQHTHLELATKYYLNTQAQDAFGNDAAFSRLDSWLGPNCRDRLDLKLSHLLSHQIRLSEHPLARRALDELAIGKPVKRIALRGCLFYPAQIPARIDRCQPLSPQHQRATWHPVSRLDSLTQDSDHWLILERQRWLSPARCDLQKPAQQILLTATSLKQALAEHFSGERGLPLMVCSMREIAGILLEDKRYMITAANWPGANTGSR